MTDDQRLARGLTKFARGFRLAYRLIFPKK